MFKKMKVYKIPEGTDIDFMRTLQGEEGSFLNPIQDINDNWIVSVEEWNAAEFQYLKTEYAEIIAKFELIEYEPKPVDEFLI